MYQNIYCTYQSSQTTKAICDGADVRYSVMFVAADDGSSCAVLCAVYHAGSRDSAAHSLSTYGGKTTTF